MTRKDYVLLSSALREAAPSPDNSDGYARGVASAAEHIAAALEEANPHGFDRERFLKDAGVQS